MGESVQDFADKPKYLAQKCALVFRTGEKNEETSSYIDVSGEFTLSMGEKANLRKFLEQWRGKPYTVEQVDAGVPLDKLVGNWALLTVAHKKSAKGRGGKSKGAKGRGGSKGGRGSGGDGSGRSSGT